MPCCEYENLEECPNHRRSEIIHDVGKTGIVIKETPSGNLFIYDTGNGAVRFEKADRLDLIKTLLEVGRGDNPFPISDAMVDAALLVMVNEARKRFGLSIFNSINNIDTSDSSVNSLRADVRKGLEAALNHRSES